MKKKRVSLLTFVIILSLLLPNISYADVTSNYLNPLMRGADPTIVRAADGYYYSCFAVNNDIYLKKADTVLGVGTAKSRLVWARPTNNADFGYVWGPYIYRLEGKWYIYFTSGPDTSYGYGHPDSYVLENVSPDPFEGSWELKGSWKGKPGLLNTEGNGLACGVVTLGGKKYFTYTKYFWNGTENGPNPKFDECPTIVEMENPWTLTGTEGTLARPIYDWEKHGDSINEGAAVVERDGKAYFAYSASSFMNDNYCIGLSTANSSSNLLDSSSWTKHPEPLMSQSPENTAFGPGSPLFVKSEDGTEDWLIYHAGPVGGQTGSNRWVRAQRVNWNDDGFINIGIASNPSTVLNRPSGEEKSETYEAEDASFGGVTRTILGDSSKSSGSGVMQYNNDSGDYVEFTVNTNSAGSYSLNFRYNNNTSGSIPMSLEVNGGNRGISFGSNKGDAFNYDLLKVENVHLQAGSNTIRLASAGAKGLVLDALIVKRSMKYEAEDAVLSGGAAKAANHTGYSGTGFVEGMWNKGAAAKFTVEAPYAGNYSVNLRYCNGFTDDRKLSIYVNGKKVKQIDLFGYGNWDKWTERYDNLQLKAGSNTITYKYDESDSGDANLDYISVTEATTWHYEAEDAVVSGDAAIAADKAGYTGTGFVTGLTTASAITAASIAAVPNNIAASDAVVPRDTTAASGTTVPSDAIAANSATVPSDTTTASIITTASDAIAASIAPSIAPAVSFSVNVENSAAYDFKLRFSNGNTESKTLSLYVNGAKVKQMSFPSTGDWSTWSEVLETVNLNKGDNTIAFKCDNNDSGNINIDNMHLNKRTPVKYQAENAAMLGGAHTADDHLWYEGTGFVGGFETLYESIKFNVNVPNTASYTTTLRYSGAQSSNITMSLYVNGHKIKQVTLPPSADWDSWAEATETVNLNAGNNTIEYKRDDADTGRFNIDSITIDKFSGGNTRLNNSSIVSGTVYKVISKRSGKALDVSGYSNAEGALIDQWSYVGGNNQRWEIIDVGDGYYKIKSAYSGLVIDIVDGSTENMLCQATAAEKDSQKWRLEKVGKYYKIINKSNGKAFDVSNESFSNGASIHLWDYLGHDNQLWSIETPSAVERFQETTGITFVPTTATAGTDLTLQGSVTPSNATNQTIVWSMKDAGSTGAAISGNTFSAKAAGTAVVTATVMEAIEDGTDLTQEFVIPVDAMPVTTDAIISLSSANYDLIAPSDVSTDITWNSASTVTDVACGANHLTIGNDYVLTGNTLTIKSDYLASLGLQKGQKAEIEISFDKGNPVTFTVNFIDSSDPSSICYGIIIENDGGGTAKANTVSAVKDAEITLTATPESDYHFKEWQVISPAGLIITGNTFIMPDTAVKVKAIFEKNQATKHALSVNGSYAAESGQGSYAEGDTVTINAGSRSNYTFGGWTSTDGVTFTNKNSTTTTFVMPAKDVNIICTWNYNGSASGDSGSGYTPVTPVKPVTPIVPIAPAAPVVPTAPVTPPVTPAASKSATLFLAKGLALNGEKTSTLLVKPYTQNGRTMVGIRDMAALLNVDNKNIVWDAKNKAILIKTADKEIKLVVGRGYAVVNGKKVMIDVAPQAKDGRVVLPIAHVARLLGMKVAFNTAAKEVTLSIQ